MIYRPPQINMSVDISDRHDKIYDIPWSDLNCVFEGLILSRPLFKYKYLKLPLQIMYQ